jgi:hypothetical protein
MVGATSTQPTVTAPTTTTAGPSTTAPTTTAQPTTTLLTTTSAQPTTTGSATTTTGPALGRGSQAASVAAAPVGALLPVLGLVCLLGGVLPPLGGTHARRRAKHRRCRG